MRGEFEALPQEHLPPGMIRAVRDFAGALLLDLLGEEHPEERLVGNIALGKKL